jgi:hypothetical protein
LEATNGGTAPETVSDITQPGAPFSVTGLPSGTVAAGKPITATVTYAPTDATSDSSQIEIQAGDSTTLTAGLSGAGQADNGQLTPEPDLDRLRLGAGRNASRQDHQAGSPGSHRRRRRT